MEIQFYKYQGTGNDFVLVDNRKKNYSKLNLEDIAFLCDRRFGIGADGMILLEEDESFDFYMRYFNSDGREASMCGNGGRCVVAFAKYIGLITDKTKFMAVDGIHEAIVSENNYVELKMSSVSKIEKKLEGLFLDTGSPHYVKFVDSLSDININEEGRKIRYNPEFSAEGTNVNFVELTGNDEITVRTYERGVENETLSCGTGVVASSICAFFAFGEINKVLVKTKGGELTVRYKVYKSDDGSNIFDDIWLCGNAGFVYHGNIDID